MVHKTILNLNHFCYYELFKQMKISCETSSTARTLAEIIYKDLINFIACRRQFRDLFYEWDKDFYKSLFLLYLSCTSDIKIDFAEMYTRLQNIPAKEKDAYWKSVSFAIEQNENLTSVELRYTPQNYNCEHIEVFQLVINQLKRKKRLSVLKMHISGYTVEDLAGFGNLKTLFLDARVNLDELSRCCSNNPNLWDLTVLNGESAGRRLAEITPHCSQVSRFKFNMNTDGDATKYAPLAKMTSLEELKIGGVHMQGTLQTLFRAFSRKTTKLLRKLSIEDAFIDFEETKALSQIRSLNELRCGFLDSQDIEHKSYLNLKPFSQLNYLNVLEVLSKHDNRSISEQIFSILKQSQGKMEILLTDCLINWDPKGNLQLFLNNVNASDYGALLMLPTLKSLKINGSHNPGSLVELFEKFALCQSSILIIKTINPFMAYDTLRYRGWQFRPPMVPVINAQETRALSTCRKLKKLVCGFSDTENIDLLHNLLELEDLTITSKPSKGSLQNLFSALASRVPFSTLQYFRLWEGAINTQEARELAQIRSLVELQCGFDNAEDIGKFADLAKENLKVLSITSLQDFHETSHGILKVLQASESEMFFSTRDIIIKSDRCLNFLGLQMSITERYTDDSLLVALANVEWVENLGISIKRGNLGKLFNAIAMRDNNRLKKIVISDGSLDFNETLELANMKSLKEFNGTLTDARSIKHLKHLTYLGLGNSFGNSFPESIVDIFNSVKEELTISLGGEEISFNQTTGRLTLCNAFAKHSPKMARDITPLASVKNLKSVRISGARKVRSLQSFLAQLATRQSPSLREVIMETRNDEIESGVLKFSTLEFREVASIKSIRTLKCGFSESKDLELLAGLPELNYLVVGFDQEDVLKGLLRKLSLNDIPVPDNLPAQGIVGFEIRLHQIFLKEMIILKDKGNPFVVELFKMLALVSGSNLQSLILKGAPITREEAEEISKIKSLQRLIYRFGKLKDIRGLLRLNELTTLIIGCRNAHMAYPEEYDEVETLMTRIPEHVSRDLLSSHFRGLVGVAQHLDRQRLLIELPKEVWSLKLIFEPLPAGLTHQLQELIITYRYLAFEEAQRIAQIASLRRLRCGLRDAISFTVLSNLTQLECLEIKSYPMFMDISDYLVLCFKECPKLQSIDLHFNPRVQFISADFTQRAIEALKSVRDPKHRSPLRLSCFVSQVFIEPKYFSDEQYLNLSIKEYQEDKVLWIYYKDHQSV
ncbi:uncharacterized protein LOC128262556 [Drosophila gunungcola]|uniref:uncharacterized protein LOC128262556 n=1 Tax=Drosophila gunungcola TaxID=103775 RepID=UPI0022DF0BFE|nr:uncharacterized protein LOC128262556 [Drosophila gunungcola]